MRKLTNEQVRTKILERLDRTSLELIDFDYKDWIFRYIIDEQMKQHGYCMV